MRLAPQLLAIALSTLALTASLASAQTLGEVTAATGVHSTLQRQGVNSSTSTLGTVKRSLASSTKARDYDFESGSGKKSGSRRSSIDSKSRMALRSKQVAHDNGSWVTGASADKGNSSNAWAKAEAGWAAAGGKAGGEGWAKGGNGWDAPNAARR